MHSIACKTVCAIIADCYSTILGVFISCKRGAFISNKTSNDRRGYALHNSYKCAKWFCWDLFQSENVLVTEIYGFSPLSENVLVSPNLPKSDLKKKLKPHAISRQMGLNAELVGVLKKWNLSTV